MIAIIQAKRDALAATLNQAQQQYAELEATLKELDRQMCAMHGGLQELDALLAALPTPEEAKRISTYATGLNGVHEATLEEHTDGHV